MSKNIYLIMELRSFSEDSINVVEDGPQHFIIVFTNKKKAEAYVRGSEFKILKMVVGRKVRRK